MSDYINREDVKTAIREHFDSLADRVEINTIINVMPSIDIVRCKSCKHWAYGKDLCTLHDMGMMADDFCSYGERSEP